MWLIVWRLQGLKTRKRFAQFTSSLWFSIRLIWLLSLLNILIAYPSCLLQAPSLSVVWIKTERNQISDIEEQRFIFKSIWLTFVNVFSYTGEQLYFEHNRTPWGWQLKFYECLCSVDHLCFLLIVWICKYWIAKDFKDFQLSLQMAPDYDHLTLMEKVEVFEHAVNNTAGDDLAKLLWLKSPSSEVKCFTSILCQQCRGGDLVFSLSLCIQWSLDKMSRESNYRSNNFLN